GASHASAVRFIAYGVAGAGARVEARRHSVRGRFADHGLERAGEIHLGLNMTGHESLDVARHALFGNAEDLHGAFGPFRAPAAPVPPPMQSVPDWHPSLRGVA